MNFAIIATSGSQFLVAEGDQIRVDKLDKEAGEEVSFDSVLLTASEKGTTIGTPTLSGVKVSGQVTGHIKGDKIRVAKYKAKSRYDKVKGFRHSYTMVKITGIGK